MAECLLLAIYLIHKVSICVQCFILGVSGWGYLIASLFDQYAWPHKLEVELYPDDVI